MNIVSTPGRSTQDTKAPLNDKFLFAEKLQQSWEKLLIEMQGLIQSPHRETIELRSKPDQAKLFHKTAYDLILMIRSKLRQGLFGDAEHSASTVVVELNKFMLVASSFASHNSQIRESVITHLTLCAPPRIGGKNHLIESEFLATVRALTAR